MRSLLAAARRSQRLLASGWRVESTSAVPAPLADGTDTSNVYLAYSRPQPEPFNDNVVFESHPETKVRGPLQALGPDEAPHGWIGSCSAFFGYL